MAVKIIQGSITRSQTDAIVNAANSALREGGGVCGAIFGAVRKVGGPEGHRGLTNECRQIDYCPTGSAVITSSYGLPAKFIIHAVGPVWSGRHEDEIKSPLSTQEAEQLAELASAYRSVLRVCRENGLKSVTIPGISTGIFGLPKSLGAAVAVLVCEEEGEGLDVQLIAYEDDSLIALKDAPSDFASTVLSEI
jgi:O-acetyl-ADP-ribose deacetylase (regulator of RNase III)